MSRIPHVLILGGGFGGLNLARSLRYAPVRITLADRRNHHLFQPLLYQVAMGGLSPADIATPFRSIFRNQHNLNLLLDQASYIDLDRRAVWFQSREVLEYDYLVVAVGNQTTYFGQSHWKQSATGLKSLQDALSIREQLLLSWEMAVCAQDLRERRQYLTYVVVGGGPTGVEMAGAIAEIGLQTMTRDYPEIRPDEIRVMLVEGGDRLLNTYPPDLSQRARTDLEQMGVEVRLNTRVTDVAATRVRIGDEQVDTTNVVWAAGNEATGLEFSRDMPRDRMGRIHVESDLSLKDWPQVFIIGDAAHCSDPTGKPLPGVAQVAIQQGQYLARMLKEQRPRNWRPPFQYFDKGNMATIGRAKAIAWIGNLQFGGWWAWILWAFVHIMFLISARNRIRVMIEWIWYYLSFRPGARIIYWQQPETGPSKPNHRDDPTPEHQAV